MLNINDLADEINNAIGATDKDGNPIATTSEMIAYATAVVNSLAAASLNNAPGTVMATGTPTTPIADGSASSGLIIVLPVTWLSELQTGFPTAVPAQLSIEANASTTYLTASSSIAFAAGQITGLCTATPANPGILQNGAGTGGELTGIAGSSWSSAVLAALGASGPLGEVIYSAIADYLIANTEASYAANTVTGAFAIGGGPMTLGTGIGGTLQ